MADIQGFCDDLFAAAPIPADDQQGMEIVAAAYDPVGNARP